MRSGTGFCARPVTRTGRRVILAGPTLNHFELIAISIAKGVIDEEFYKSWMAYAVIRDFRAAHELIAIARAPAKPGDSGDKVAYCYLEALCQRWNQTDRMFFRPIRDP